MADQILVLLKRDEPIEEIIPYVEKVTRPGAKVIFLVPYPVDPANWWRGRRLSIEAEIQSKLAVKIAERYPWEKQRELAEAKLSFACEALHKQGITTAVDVYAGPLRKALKPRMSQGDVHLVLMRGGIGLRIKRLLHGVISSFGLFKRSSFCPVVLLHPGTLF